MVLPISMRLKGVKCFDHLHRSGRRFHGSSMLLIVAKAKPKFLKSTLKKLESQSCRCAVAISSKVNKKAVIRNKIRRALHHHLRGRLENRSINSDSWALISLKPNSSNKDNTYLLKECDQLLINSGLVS